MPLLLGGFAGCMGLLALGINHKSANIALRERVAFAPEQMADALQNALSQSQLSEVVILSTCNRTELFGLCADDKVMDVLAWLSDYHQVPEEELSHCYFSHQEQEAVRHMIEVASGLDSMVLGEPQIFGQMKSAFAVAREAGSVDVELSRIFSHVFSVAKKVRTDTAIGKNPVSVAYAAVNLSRHIFSELSQTRALLIGAGETIELVAKHLVDGGVKEIVVANRTLGRARDLALRFHAEAVLLSEIPAQLAKADIVISSTASQLPLLGKGAVEHALKLRKHRPILMIDLAVPRDIEEQVGELNDIYLYSIDDLTDIVDENIRGRVSEANKADVIIEAGVEGYLQKLRAEDAVSTLKSFRSKAEQTRDSELQKALKQLQRGEPAEQVLSQMARNLTNKLIHSPSIHMKKAGAEGRDDLIGWAQTLFGLDLDDKNDDDASSK